MKLDESYDTKANLKKNYAPIQQLKSYFTMMANYKFTIMY